MKANVLRIVTFEASRLTPATPADGSSLEEQINAWLAAAGEREFLDIRYQTEGAGYTALLVYTQ